MTTQKPRQLLGKALFGSLCGFTMALGVWQTYRYFEVPSQPLAEEDDPNLVKLPTNRLDLSRSVLLGPRKLHTESKEYGYFVYSPSLQDQLLVCIGWMPKSVAKEEGTGLTLAAQEITVHCNRGAEKGNYFSPPTPSKDGTFLWANRESMLLAVGLDPQTSRMGETYQPTCNELRSKHKPEPYLTKWTHAGYAVTWYSLTAAGLFMMKKMFA
ncbi:hypothetical protein BASA81_011020 [Batrachochytrium salamandrivorans]|nr:hypothetical protein BASA81_011020 [Batrachochytrium salamandrivorans]